MYMKSDEMSCNIQILNYMYNILQRTIPLYNGLCAANMVHIHLRSKLGLYWRGVRNTVLSC